jgi:hypothetical protein
MGRFITRHSSLPIDANNLLSTNHTISKHAFKLSYTKAILCMIMSSYKEKRANLCWEERWYGSPRCSCSVMYAFHDSSQTILITCHHKFKSHISADTVLSEYPDHPLHHVNSDHFYLYTH